MISPSLCPVCGARNDCALASPELAAHPCWCYNVSINPERLKALRVEQLDLTCLCPRCAEVEKQLPSAQPQGLA
ncbi:MULTISPECIES: cysteine-rich CWC family protein [unclassified Pseudomonas]|uniref:cysteine-rich CWC family protein n=1 Tax=unclassified Pseudomonas TaxID=196821 RepID=UPI0028D1F1AD|nr:cysteine-rich CWC family protein [uncultured Pseudomonas sp.]